MYRNSYQRGLLSIFSSGGSSPLAIWDTMSKDGYIKRFLDPEIKTMVLEIRGANVSTTYIICPKGNEVLGITMPFLVMVCKNLYKYFSFEVTVLDESGSRRRFRVSNFQSTTQILPLSTVMPICLSPGWNQIQFNLADFTKRAYKTQFVEVQKLKINANIRLKRIYFAEKLMSEEELPNDYKLYFPLPQKVSKSKIEAKPRSEAEIRKPSQDQVKPSGTKLVASTEKLPTEALIETIPEDKESVPGESAPGESEVGGEQTEGEALETEELGSQKPVDENVEGENAEVGEVAESEKAEVEKAEGEKAEGENVEGETGGENVTPAENVEPPEAQAETEGEGL